LAQGAVCLELVGEPGIGKTTMLALLSRAAVAHGAQVLDGCASEFEHDLPFGVVIDALDGHLSQVEDRWSRSLGADVAAELVEIFPALQSPDSEPLRVGLPSERFRGYRAVGALLERLAAAQPLVLALDDVHWADSSSVELIGALLRRPPAARVMIALAYRPHQASQRLLRELAVAVSDGVLERIELGPLSQAEADALLAEGTSARDRECLFAESGGNPFYLHQLARAPGGRRGGGDLGAGVPLAVAASLFAELESLSSATRRLARAAAVAGDPFDLDLAGHVAELDRVAALAGLDELVAAGLVRAGSGPLRFVFRHPLVRRAVYESAQPGWRIAAHELADAALARRGASATARAHHVERSAGIGDAQAIKVLVAAAAAAIVPSATAHWLNAAVRLAPDDGDLQSRLLCRLGEALAAAGLLEDSRTALSEALTRWPTDSDPEGRIGLIVLCASVERLLGRHQEARARLAAATREIDDPDSAAGVALAIEVAIERIFSTDYATVPELALAAVRSATVLGDPILYVAAAMVAGFGDFCVRDVAGARMRISEAAQLLSTLDDATVARQPDALSLLGWTERCLDHYEAAVCHFTRGIAVARASGRSKLYVQLTAGRAYALAQWGRVAEAQEASEEAVEAARLSENPQTLAWALMVNCFTHTQSGSLVTAVRNGREAVALDVDQSLISAGCGIHLGTALAEGGDSEEGVDLILKLAGGPELQLVPPMLRPFAYEAMTRAEINRGRVARATSWARRAATIVDGIDCDLPRALADRAAASVLLGEGDVVAAADRALASADKADAIQAYVEAGRSRMLAGRALIVAGQRKGAGEQLRAAEAQLAACGALRLREQCARELRRLGLRVTSAPRRGDQSAWGLAALSGRERQVADLVRTRHTNREIAEQLFLSEKTVESHLRSVFVKLGVSSRADVARTLDDAPS
jgi:DNA-binding CsgD family transcriptional regulator